MEDVAVMKWGNWYKHTASLISSLCSSVNWFCSSRSNRSFSARSRSRSRRAFSRCCWVVEAPNGAPRVRSGSLPRLEVYGREGKEGCDEDAIYLDLECMEEIERFVELG